MILMITGKRTVKQFFYSSHFGIKSRLQDIVEDLFIIFSISAADGNHARNMLFDVCSVAG